MEETTIRVKGGVTVKIPSGVKYGDITLNCQMEVERCYNGKIDEREVGREMAAIAKDCTLEAYKEYKSTMDEFTRDDISLPITPAEY